MYSIERMLHKMHVKPDGFSALTYNYFLSQFALGMVGVFGVVYLFELFEEWYWGLILVAVFYGAQRVVTVVLMPVIAELLGHVGYRRVMAMSLLRGMLMSTFLRLFVDTPRRWISFLGFCRSGELGNLSFSRSIEN